MVFVAIICTIIVTNCLIAAYLLFPLAGYWAQKVQWGDLTRNFALVILGLVTIGVCVLLAIASSLLFNGFNWFVGGETSLLQHLKAIKFILLPMLILVVPLVFIRFFSIIRSNWEASQ